LAGTSVIEFNKIKICVNDQVYEPAEDTELMFEIINAEKNEKVLEVGPGTGIISVSLALKGAEVTAIDINPYASEATLCTSKINKVQINIINGDLLSPIRPFVFDVAVFNPPYLPFEEYDSWIGYSWSGGKSGAESLIKFLSEVKASRIYTLYSSLSDEDAILAELKNVGLCIKTKREKQIGLETLFGIELVKCLG